MPTSSILVFSTYAVQAVQACILAAVLLRFFRLYRRDYLAKWSLSWWALAGYMTLAGLGMLLARSLPATNPQRLVVSGAALVIGYWQIAWLVLGSYEVATGKVAPRHNARALFAALAAFAMVLLAVSTPAAITAETRMFVRVGLRSLVSGAAFLGAAYGVARGTRWHAGAGRQLVTLSLGLYGLQHVHYFVIGIPGIGGESYAPYLGFADFLLQMGIGLGMVIGLLEEERSRVLRASEEIEHLAYHDALTGLANRRLFADHVRLALAQAERTAGKVAVLALNLDRFKLINGTLGRAAGDEVLRAVAERLHAVVRRGDTVGRLGGDVFGVCFTGLLGDAPVIGYAGRLLDELRRPFTLHAQEVYATASIGVAVSPDDGRDAESLLRNAELAGYRAKEAGRNTAQFYDPQRDELSQDRFVLERSVRRSIELAQLVVYYQPIASATTGEVVAVEALVRWRHPERGLLAPAEFIPLAESIGLSDEMDFWVMRAATTQAQAWREQGLPAVAMSVNLSGRTFYHPDLVARVGRVLEKAGHPAQDLVLEITETVAMESAERALAVLTQLKRLGVRIAVDDFGTGHSSLAYLRNYPIDTLKLDRSFVRDLTKAADAAAIAQAVIALSHSLSVAVVAEGVESNAQLDQLARHGCDFVQGYLVSEPLPPEQCARIIGAVGRVRAAT